MNATSEGSASAVIQRNNRIVWPLLVIRSIWRSACVTQTTPVRTTKPETQAVVAVLQQIAFNLDHRGRVVRRGDDRSVSAPVRPQPLAPCALSLQCDLLLVDVSRVRTRSNVPPNRGGLLTGAGNPLDMSASAAGDALSAGPEVLKSGQGTNVGYERSCQDRVWISIRAKRQRARGFCRGRPQAGPCRGRSVRRSRTPHPGRGEGVQLSRRPAHRTRYPRALGPRRVTAVGDRRRAGQGQRPDRLHDAGRLHLRQSDRREAVEVAFEAPSGTLGRLGGRRFALGLRLRGYRFDKYKTRKKDAEENARRNARFHDRLEPCRRRARRRAGAFRHRGRRRTGAQSGQRAAERPFSDRIRRSRQSAGEARRRRRNARREGDGQTRHECAARGRTRTRRATAAS